MTDANGCTDSTSVSIIEQDLVAPTVTTQDITVYLDGSGSVSITASDVDNGSTDNCTMVMLAIDSTDFDCSELGANTVMLYVTDGSNNVDSLTATVTVLDTLNPTVATQDITVYLDGSGSASITASDVDNGSTDNCTTVSLALDSTDFDCSELGANTVMLYVTDGSNNVDSLTATVTVLDTILPTITCLADTTICSATFTFNLPAVNDNCGAPSIVQTEGIPSGGTYPVGTTVNKFIVTDASGNRDSCSFTVTRDAAPTIADAGADANICVSTYTLQGNTVSVGTGQWTSPTGATITDPSNPTSGVTNLTQGIENVFVWTISNGVCDPSTDTVRITYDLDPTTANAGSDQTLCAEFTTDMTGNAPTVGIGTWTVIEGAGNIVSLNDPSSTVNSLSLGTNRFVWTISNGTCIDSRDTVVITTSNNPTADAGADQTIFKDDGVNLSVSSDVNGQAGTTYLWTSPLFDANIDDPMTSDGRTKAFPTESTEFSILVTNALGCEGRDTINVTVNTQLTFSSAFTPNNDGMNDLWLIKNLDDETIASHKVVIYDGFGSEILSSTNFQGWDGKYEGEDLPVGSYYYAVETVTTTGEKRIETGIVSILR